MKSSSRMRRKNTFLPWLAALVFGATAHAGWLLHELREAQPERDAVIAAPLIDVDVDVDVHVDRGERDDLDLWVHASERYTYTIDRRALDRIASADLEALGVSDSARLAVLAQSVSWGEPIELRNIRAGTPLHLVGLRTGDRVLAIAGRGEQGGELGRVEVAIERRGRAISLVYNLV